MDYIYKKQLTDLIESQSAQLVEEIKKEGMGPFTGGMILIAMNNSKQKLYDSLSSQAYAMGSNPTELKEFIDNTVDTVINKYVKL